MFGIRRGLLLIIIIAAFTTLLGSDVFLNKATLFIGDLIQGKVQTVLSEQAKKHILYGTRGGGGHKYGVGKACKSEFPQDWNDGKILSTVEKIAANDNLNWKKQSNGYYVADEMVQGVKVRVVLNGNKSSVVTAYPLNGKRNACLYGKGEVNIPAPANDNFND